MSAASWPTQREQQQRDLKMSNPLRKHNQHFSGKNWQKCGGVTWLQQPDCALPSTGVCAFQKQWFQSSILSDLAQLSTLNKRKSLHTWRYTCGNAVLTPSGEKKKLKLGGVRVLVAWLMLSGAEGKCRDSPLHKYQDLLLGILVKCCTIEQNHWAPSLNVDVLVSEPLSFRPRFGTRGTWWLCPSLHRLQGEVMKLASAKHGPSILAVLCSAKRLTRSPRGSSLNATKVHVKY